MGLDMAERRKAVALYRVSTKEQQTSGLGLAAQAEIVRKELDLYGYELIEEIREVGSGRAKKRPPLDKALEICREKNAVLVVARVDRLSRDPATLMALADGNVEISVISPRIESKMMLMAYAMVAMTERQFISQRTREGIAQSPNKPIAYQNCALTQDVLEIIKRLRAKGMGFRSIHTHLKRIGVKTKEGKDIKYHHVLYMQKLEGDRRLREARAKADYEGMFKGLEHQSK